MLKIFLNKRRYLKQDKNETKRNSENVKSLYKKKSLLQKKKICFEYTIFSLKKRLLAGFLTVIFLFALLICRVFILSVGETEFLQIKAQEQWTRNLFLTAKRGIITDSNGLILANNNVSYNLFFRAKEITDPVGVSRYISDLLSLNFEKVYEKAQNVFVSESLVKLQIDEGTAIKIINKNFDGVYLTENITRNYPYGKLLSQVLGFLTSDSTGQSGVELYYDNILSGTDGKYLTQSDVRGVVLDESINYYIEGVDGLNISLCIDVNIQNIVESVLSQIMEEQKPKRVSAIILDPNNSKILSMAINPSFDLNNVPRDDISSLMELTKNFTVSDVYEPGSTFKILTLAAALSEGLTDINEHFYCPGFRIVDGEKIKCWKTTGHGSQTLVECVQNSCNCCFMDLALRLGKDKLYYYLNKFGIGTKSGVDISGESSGLLLDKELVQNVDLARIGFGQTVAVNQLQLINSFCSVINGGKLCTPSILNNYYNNQNEVVFENQNLILNETVSEDVSKTLRYLLEQSLSKSGEMTFINGYRVAGKTGTAQKYGSDGKIAQGKYVSSFFGFLNGSSLPEYALLLCVDEPSTGAYYGSVVAKPYAKIIFEKIIEYKNISKNDEKIESKNFIMPNLVGFSLVEAQNVLNDMKVDYEIDGENGIILEQFPKQNTVVDYASTVLLKT